MYTEGQEVFTCSASFYGGVEIHRYIITKVVNNMLFYGKANDVSGVASLPCSYLHPSPREAFDNYKQKETAFAFEEVPIV